MESASMSDEVKTLREKELAHDDGKPWGHITNDGVWHLLPKTPLLLADLGPPPFQVMLPSGQVRHVVHEPPEQGMPGA
jgi:hypothetical protein